MSINLPPYILKGKQQVALITGAAQGIGAKIAESFLAKGYFVISVDLQEELGLNQEKKWPNQLKFFSCDLSNTEQVKNLAKTIKALFPVIDLIIHNARFPDREKKIVENIEKEWDQAFSLTLKNPVFFNELMLDKLKKSSNPSIQFIGSTNGRYVSHQPMSYHVMKGALAQTVRYLASKYAELKIRVNLLNPGIVDVPGRTRKNPELFQSIVKKVVPLQRTAEAQEIGHACLFFASEGAKYLTGTTLDLDGGEHLADPFHLMISHINSEITQEVSQ